MLRIFQFLLTFNRWFFLIPTVIAFCIPLTIFTTYGIAVYYGHVYPVWPYISDTGTIPPESCIFSQLLNLGAFVASFVIYIRYRQVREYVINSSVDISRTANITSLIFGLLACFGLVTTANFQETNAFEIHIAGAFLCFIAASVFLTLETAFTWKINREAKVLFWTRAVLSGLASCATLGFLIPVHWAFKENKGGDFLLWKPEDPGYKFHVISSISEWILVFSVSMWISTLYWDLKTVRISEPSVQIIGFQPNQEGGRTPHSYKLELA